MDRKSAISLIQKTFEYSYNEINFRNFIKNLFKDIRSVEKKYEGNLIPNKYKESILSYKKLFEYELEEDRVWDKIDILTVEMKSIRSLETARTFQRNFIAEYLRQRDLNAVVVAFYTGEDKGKEWRFSFVKRDLEFIDGKVSEALTPAKRYSYLVGENESSHTAQQQLLPLLEKDLHNPSISEFEKIFSVEKVSKEFFAKYEDLYLRLLESIKKLRAEGDKNINWDFELKGITNELFCKKTLGQIVFLYFLQKKGWLGVPRGKDWSKGDKRFMRSLFERTALEEKNYFNDCLEPFFYEALATERENDWYDKLQCKIPFLNGGLFEPLNLYNWQDTFIYIPNELFSNKNKDGILDIFDTYNFTVKEDEPLEKEVAIDPEMLGKVFEELLEVKDRKSKGAFYTPREIVHYMCQESLVNYLYNKLPHIPKENLDEYIKKGSLLENDEIKKYAKEIDESLRTVKVCDPAIGSGAFPVGIMHEVINARRKLVEAKYLPEAQKRSSYAYKKEFIQNSLHGVDIEASAIEIAKLRLWLSLIVDEDDRENIEPLPNLDYKLVQGNSLLSIDRTSISSKTDLLKEIERDKDIVFDESSKRNKLRLKNNINKNLDSFYKEYNQWHKDFPVYFDFEVHFSEVFRQNNGFDIVIANPPYIDSESMVKQGQAEFREFINNKFNTAKGNWDIYIPFFELAFNLLNRKGNISFITPDKWLSKPFGYKMREALLNNISSVVKAGRKVFETAKVDSILTFISKVESKKVKVLNYKNQQFNLLNNVDKSNLKKPYILDFIFSNELNILLKIENVNSLLGEVSSCENACATSDCYELKKILKNNDLDSTEELKVINTGTIDKFISKWGRKKMTYLKDKYLYPIVEKEDFDNIFKNSYARKTYLPKIIVKGLTLLDACLDLDANIIPGKTTLIICNEDANVLKFIAGFLNSKLPIFYIKEKYSSSSYNGGVSFTKDMINNFPISKISKDEQKPFVELVDKILQAKENDFEADTSDLEDKIDQLVYKLYSLTRDEIEIIEGKNE